MLSGEPVYHNAMQTMEGSRDMSMEHEADAVLRDMLTQIDDSMAILTTLERASLMQQQIQHWWGTEEKEGRKVTSAIDKTLSMCGFSIPYTTKSKRGA